MSARRRLLALLVAALASAGARAAAAEPTPDGLCDVARAGLTALWAKVPGAHVTSARRTRADEARAFADNIARKRDWMRILKAHARPELADVQAWIDAHWRALRGQPAPIAEHLATVFAGMSDAEMGQISPHFGGRAIDLRKQHRIVRRLLLGLPGVRSVLDEGSHWHVDFRCGEPPER